MRQQAVRGFFRRPLLADVAPPVLHVVADGATSLYEALLASRRAYNEFMEQPHRLSFAWGRSYLEEERKFFGKDPFYQGFKENYNDVQNLIRFADQQGMLGRKLTVEELFTDNTQNT